MGGKSATLAWQRYCATAGNALWWASCALPCCTTRHSAHAAGRAACCTLYSCAMRRCVRAAGGVACCCAAYSCAMRRCVRAAGGWRALRRIAAELARRAATRAPRRPQSCRNWTHSAYTAPRSPAGAMVAPSPGGQVSPPRRCRSRACAAPRRYECRVRQPVVDLENDRWRDRRGRGCAVCRPRSRAAAGGRRPTRGVRGAAASVRRPATLAVCGRVRYRERDPRFLAHRPDLDTEAYAVGLDGGGVSRPTKRNLRRIVAPAPQHRVSRG
jgi:hypothetical protein